MYLVVLYIYIYIYIYTHITFAFDIWNDLKHQNLIPSGFKNNA